MLTTHGKKMCKFPVQVLILTMYRLTLKSTLFLLTGWTRFHTFEIRPHSEENDDADDDDD